MPGDTNRTRVDSAAEHEASQPSTDEIAGACPKEHPVRQGRERDEVCYRQMIDGLPQIVYEVDITGRLVYANTFALKSFGFTAPDLEQGLELHQILHPDSVARAREGIDRALRGTGSNGEEYLAMRKDGSTFPIRVYSQGVFENGRATGVRGVVIDITETKRAEAALQLSEQYYRTLFEHTGSAMITFGADAVISRCNSRFEALVGWSAAEVVGKKPWDIFVAPEDLKRVLDYNRRRRLGDATAPDDYEMTILTREGGRRRVHLFVQAIPGTSDIVCSLIDITDRARMESALRKSEQRYALVVKASNDGIWDWDIDSGSVFYSARYKAILGYVGHEFPDTLDSWKNAVHPDDLANVLAANASCAQGCADQFEVEFRMRHKDGSYRWILGRGASVRDESGRVFRMAGTHADITRRKLNEHTTRALYDISKAIATADTLRELYKTIHAVLGRVIDVTNFFIALYDEPEDRVVFSYFADEMDELYDIRNVSDPETRGLTVHILRTGEPLFISQAEPIPPEKARNIGVVGTPAAVWLGVPLKLKGRTMGAMAVQHYTNPRHYTDADVTFMEAVSEQVALAIERKSNEEELTRFNNELEDMVEQRTAELRAKAAELEAANRRLTELDEIKSALVSSISHELRTPLTSIRGFAKLTRKDFVRHFHPLAANPTQEAKGDRIRQNLDIIETEGERLTRLINDFLDINRIEAGKAAWNDQLLNPCRAVRQAVAALAGTIKDRQDIDFRLRLPPRVPLVHADPDKIQQVLINLINNACKFTRKGSIEVTVSGDQEHLTFTVADTGMGIAPEDLPYIFDKFFKADNGDTLIAEAPGTGLGLAICKEIVEHYGGSIRAHSTPGRGSTFAVTLPSVHGSETACE
ncbi:PAS domain S-box protein [Pseudodesulfovibrio sp. F-1]|uniref:histidine kinase n=1 Tax=Pseudodesulfovibrio alkaliphilus TaxID=2661613 RepID=A0A7K1KPU8_9BACT|nr:PAS domain S-box protein [Pseudodesulfovibrio alkaliphilus]MUM77901.1 PAS domain S-box protein [Pseudodesulfovibrio alkaliphilus]